MNKRIKNLKELLASIKKGNREYLETIKQHGGRDLFLRAFTAQLLWFFLLFSLVQRLIPMKNFLISNAILLIILAGFFFFIWKNIKDKLPPWISDIIKGEFFYDFEINL